tara:strand:- start:2764 stop:2997 length:234 start_codon:yes stop_codon:yes gene_type:complete
MTTITPAYGRDYKNKRDAQADFDKGLDFVHQPSGRYCSKRDFPGKKLVLRYGKMRKVMTVEGDMSKPQDSLLNRHYS